MQRDKYSAVWVSHSSMSDFLRCPRLYYLRNVYKDPATRRKMSIVAPATSLGIAVHETLEALKELPLAERMQRNLMDDIEESWQKVSGEKGGFRNVDEERVMKARALEMIERVIEHPGPIARKTVRLTPSASGMLPHYYLDEEANIILCGLVDWLEYCDDDTVRILDFKTGLHEERTESLQLPIYLLLVSTLQKRRVSGASYWYLSRDDEPVDVELPTIEDSYERVLAVARQVKEVRESRSYTCPAGESGCSICIPFEKVLRGEAVHVGVGGYNQDMYMIGG